MRIEADRAREIVVSALEHVDVAPAAAAIQARWLVEGELRGHPSHGIRRLPVLVERVRKGLINVEAEPRLKWGGEAVLLVDGDRGLGPAVGTRALAELEPRARRLGVAVAAIRNTSHLGLLSPYVEGVAAGGLLGIALTTSEALVHPWGGARALIGTNPIAVGVPTAAEPFALDMATGEISMGKVLAYADRGEELEPGWAIDAAGRETRDPTKVAAISPFGGAKGYGLGLAFELLVGILTRTAFGTEVLGTLDVEHPATKGDLFVCLAPERFLVDGETIERLGAYLEELRGSAVGDEPVAVPGDRARARRRQALAVGIELPDELVERLRELSPAAGSLS
ncbi:MAG TPA: Ldh family oxidoreductase [Solirubrobacterales bacterium]|nr:Ldh family oxidoreductase [Solirubrobacterales bacterium]